MVFLVTDGKSNKGRHLTIPRSQALKGPGLKIFGVVVGENVRGIDEMVNVLPIRQKNFFSKLKNSTDSCKLLTQWFKGIPR